MWYGTASLPWSRLGISDREGGMRRQCNQRMRVAFHSQITRFHDNKMLSFFLISGYPVRGNRQRLADQKANAGDDGAPQEKRGDQPDQCAEEQRRRFAGFRRCFLPEFFVRHGEWVFGRGIAAKREQVMLLPLPIQLLLNSKRRRDPKSLNRDQLGRETVGPSFIESGTPRSFMIRRPSSVSDHC